MLRGMHVCLALAFWLAGGGHTLAIYIYMYHMSQKLLIVLLCLGPASAFSAKSMGAISQAACFC